MEWVSVEDEINRDLGKAKNRLTKIDIEIAVLKNEKEILSEKAWELRMYLEKIEEARKPLPPPPKED